MTNSIALAGKGGTGKTTIACMVVRYLVENGKVPVLAVDADANSNLNEVLGLEVKETLGDAREEMKKGISGGMTKDVFIEMKLQKAVVETPGLDLIVMGRPEGPGCYCAANTLLSSYLDKLIENYKYVVIDNEAGMEHISRLTTKNIDILLVVSDPTRRGIQTAARIFELTDKLMPNISRKMLIVNQVRKGQERSIEQAVQDYALDLAGMVPEDLDVRGFDLDGRPIIQLGKDSKALIAVYEILEETLKS